MKARIWILFALIAPLALPACMSAQEHAADVEAANAEANQLTVGTVQKEIRVGMSGGEVASLLGAPNIVTTDENRREVWVYDKISTNRAYSTSSGGVSALVLVGALVGDALVGGAGSGSYSSSAGASATTQKTLTVIIKYDEQGLVRDFAYHSSTF
jgi:outer membrane protein assembly factor BamE (lipoprotein component of BamABCDE complex)